MVDKIPEKCCNTSNNEVGIFLKIDGKASRNFGITATILGVSLLLAATV